jgi:nucleoside-diphosphate-sugar epimerase
MYGGGELGRDYVHVSDVVVAFWLAATLRTGKLYNIGSGVPVAVAEIAEELTTHCESKGYEPEFVKAQIRDGEALLIQIDASKFTAHTGWEPTVELSSGIRSTFDWIEGQYT